MRVQFSDIESEFISRESEINTFINMVKKKQAKNLLEFYGIGGIGKTWLLTRLTHECEKHRWLSAVIDFSHGFDDYLAILTEAGNQLGREKLMNFNKTVDDYVQKLSDTYVPVSHELTSERVRDESEKTFTGSLASVVGAGIIGMRSVVRIANLLESMQADIEQSFISSIQEIASNQRVVLFFDTYEHIEESQLGKWVQEFAISIGRQRGAYVVLAGRNRLRWDREWRSRFSQFELGYFNRLEVMTYLLQNRQMDYLSGNIIDAVWQLTRGHPLCVGLAGDFLAERWEGAVDALVDPDLLEETLNERMVSAFLMERILERVDVQLRMAIMLAAITRWFDAAILEEVGKLPRSQQLIDQLQKYSFIRYQPQRGYMFHEIVRELLLVKWYHDNWNKFLELNREALKFFEKQAPKEPSNDRGLYNLERLYHQLIVDETKGLALFENLFKLAEDLQQLDYCQSLLVEVKNYPGLMKILTDQ